MDASRTALAIGGSCGIGAPMVRELAAADIETVIIHYGFAEAAARLAAEAGGQAEQGDVW